MLSIYVQNNAPKSSDTKTNTATSSQAAAAAATAAAQKGGMLGNIMKRFGLQRPPQAHLPDDKNKAVSEEDIFKLKIIKYLLS